MKENYNTLILDFILEELHLKYYEKKRSSNVNRNYIDSLYHAENLMFIIDSIDKFIISKEQCNNLKKIFAGNDKYEDLINKLKDFLSSRN